MITDADGVAEVQPHLIREPHLFDPGNAILESQPATFSWYHPLWTFLFGIFYLQYKLNRLQEVERQIEDQAKKSAIEASAIANATARQDDR